MAAVKVISIEAIFMSRRFPKKLPKHEDQDVEKEGCGAGTIKSP